MLDQALKGINDYEVHLTEKMAHWSAAQHVAFAAAIAERWLPAYESFSLEEDWGDPASLRRGLEAVWGHVEGRTLSAKDANRYIGQIEEITPHMDDFDAEDALIACVILTDALQACGDARYTLPRAAQAALGVLEGLVHEWPLDAAEQLHVWQKSAVRKEVQAQRKLLDEIDAVTDFDKEAIKALRSRIRGLSKKGRARPKRPTPPGLTNQTAFEQYRRYVESDLRGWRNDEPELIEDDTLFLMKYYSYWLGRYSRRMQTIDGSYGQLADELGQQALIARNREIDGAVTEMPDWDEETRQLIELSMKNMGRNDFLDAATPMIPHAYGPSLRRLWMEAKRNSQSEKDVWNHVRAWGNHRPIAWEREDRRKKQGVTHSNPELAEAIARPLSWKSSSDPIHPWTTEVDGARWRIRINDFPDELMYSLIIGSENAGDFHDWPETWRRAATT